MRGWIKLHRNIIDKAIWKESTPEQKTILITLLMMANHKQSEWEWKGEKFICNPGQFITSLKSIKENCGKGISVQNIRTAIKRFEKYEFLTSQSTNKNRLITIVNWTLYQGEDEQTNKQTNKQLTSNQQATNKQLTTNKNDKNIIMKECKSKDIYIDEKEIFNYWNSKGGVIHHNENMFAKNRNKISTAIKNYGKNNILVAIDRLNSVVLDEKCRYNFRWNIFRFLKQSNGISNWLDDGQLWNNYKNKGGESNNSSYETDYEEAKNSEYGW